MARRGGICGLMAMVVSMVAATTPSCATVLLDEPFAYSSGALLANSGGNWTQYNIGGTDELLVLSTASDSGSSLSFAGIQAPTGNRVFLDDNVTEKLSRSFTAVTAEGDVVYASFLAKPVAQPTGTGNYFVTLMSPTASAEVGRVYSRPSGGGVQFGIRCKNVAAVVWDSTVRPLNQTCFLVVKHTLATGSGADTASLFVNPTPGAGQPSPTATCTAGVGDNAGAAGIGRFGMREATASGNTTGGYEVDELRVATTWAEVTPAAPAAVSDWTIID